MTRLEDELRKALRRESPPDGFAGRVLSRSAQAVSAKHHRRWSVLFGTRRLRWAAAAAICMVLAGAGLDYWNQQKERARGEAAKAQLMLALRITGSKLQFVQQKIEKIQAPRTDRN
jgi:hypothetical protein